MKLTLRWDGSEGLPSEADVQRLMDAATGDDPMTALDFLQDALIEIELLYSGCLALFHATHGRVHHIEGNA